jgi:hypothetical protein
MVLAGLSGDRSVAEVCREHEIADKPVPHEAREAAGRRSERLAGKPERCEPV